MNASSRTALLIGFEPFNGESVNPSERIVAALDGAEIAGHRIVGAILPTAFAPAPEKLDELLTMHRPSLVLALGQAGGRDGFSLERVAINVIDARVADNAGDKPIDVAVIDGAPNAYFTSLPIKAMLLALHEAHIPASVSNTAGTFVCNQIFYALAHAIATEHRHMRGGFVHVPYLPEQAARHDGAPALDLETMIRATRICLDVALRTHHDLHFAAGATH